jgi:hypothetical protein
MLHILADLFGAGTWGTGGNMVAWVICGVIVFVCRDFIGKRMAGWWARHHGPHAIEQHKQALREHEEAKSGQDHSDT